MNVPVLTLAGKMHIERVGASLLTNVGLPQLVAHSPEEFVQIAAGYAKDPSSLTAIRTGLRDKFVSSPVMNAQAYAKDFTAALRTVWKQWCETGK